MIPGTESQNAYYRYQVSGLSHIGWLVTFFNGNLLLTKVQNRFFIWAETFNKLALISNLGARKKISYQPVRFNPFLKEATIRISLESAWLAGFIDAEGGFYGSLSKNKRFHTGFRERYKFYIPQKSERWVLARIGQVIEERALKKMGLERKPESWKKTDYVTDYKNRPNLHRLEINKFQFLEVLIDYLDKYTLLSKQQLVFVRWKRCFLQKDQYREAALKSEKGMRRYKRRFISIGKIREVFKANKQSEDFAL